MSAWYVKPLRFFGAAGQFFLDVKIGLDLGRSIPDSVRVARAIWGWRQ
ncbi:hypothetical protein [Rhizobium sp. 768_B6_N1_8]